MYLDTVEWNPQLAVVLGETAARFGFTGIVWNVDIEPPPTTGKIPIKVAPACPVQPIRITLPNATGQLQTKMSEFWASGLLAGTFDTDPRNLVQITRATVLMTDVNQLGFLNFLSRSQNFDLVAVVPLEEKVWLTLLAQGDFDIIRLDLCSARLPFSIKRHQLMQLVRRGVSFEICLNDALRNPTARRHLFANVQQLIRFLPHDKIFITSGAKHPLDIRSSFDVSNLAQIMGMRKSPKNVMRENAMACIYKGAARRTAGGIVGTIDTTKMKF